MDIVTQGLLGATFAAAAARPFHLRAAAASGFAAGLLADADALAGMSGDTLLALEYHRHFTHALSFVPFGALLGALLLWPLMRRHFTFPRLYLYTLLGYAPSGFLDACTSYGTSLLWPFSDARVAWSVVSIVDPLFSGALLLALMVALVKRNAVPAYTGLVLGALYLAAGAVQHERARDAMIALAQQRGHAPERMLVKPTFANILLWRGLYIESGEVYADAVRAGVEVTVYPGEQAALAPESTATGRSPEARFAAFSDGWLIADPRHPGRLGDARYSMLPTALRPLWGIDGWREDAVHFVTDRSMSQSERARFLDMLLGNPIGP